MGAAGKVLAGLAVVLSLAACATGSSTASPGGAAPTVSGAWVRPPQGMDRPAAGYLVITGGAQADALLSAASPVAGKVEIHETSMDSSGMTGMHPIGRLDVPAGATVTLQPGGYHLMFMDVTGTITVGGSVEIRLTFEKAGVVTVQAEVKQG
ncbi:MAG TPA: copper chaperone PCu(A)C [Candidatus Limnocylindrales bacterium]|nr:copper chaperone PCu(A)C [Candidatus Limnocylindrales bacterium]